MVIKTAVQPASGPPRCLRWKDIVDWRLIGAAPHNPIQQLIDRNLQRFGRREPPDMVFDYFETQIAMVEAGVGFAVIPTFANPARRHTPTPFPPLTHPTGPTDLFPITHPGRQQHAG